MLSESMQEKLNAQLNAELYSAYLYLSMSAYFEACSMGGFANWMRVQAQEELSHAMKFFDYLAERGGRITLTAIDAPRTEWTSAVDAFDEVYRHEQKVTALINNLVNAAEQESDHATRSMLQWFVTEQVEEEASAERILDNLKMVGEDGTGLLMLDRELAQRVYTPPAAEGEGAGG